MKVPCSMKCIVTEGPYEVTVANVSTEGIRMNADKAYRVGIHLAVELPLLGNRTKPVLIQVRQTRPHPGRPGYAVDGAFVKKLKPEEVETARERMLAVRPVTGKTTRFRSLMFKTTCRWVRVTEEGPWLATMRDISRHGIGLVADRPFEAGMYLKVDLPSVQRKHLTPRLIKVTNSQQQPSKEEWLIGGVFLRDLSEPELRALL
jgi:hypothetical protein